MDEVLKKLLKVKKKVRYFNYREKNFESGSKTIFCTDILKRRRRKVMGKIITANEQNVIKTLVMLAENNIRDRKKELEDWDKSLETNVKVTIKERGIE